MCVPWKDIMRAGKNILLPGLFVIVACGTPEGTPQISSSEENDVVWRTRSSESASPDLVKFIKDSYQEPESEKMNRPMEEFYQQALYENEKDDQKRLEAVTTLSLYREDAVVDVLIRAASDPWPEIRYRSIETLRFAAADGFDKEGRISTVLRLASRDIDKSVAALAESAFREIEQDEAKTP